jgi:hypothetical protein
LSKGYSSYFLVQIFLPSASAETKRKIGELFSGIEIKTTAVKTAVLAGRTIEIKLQSAEIDFSEAVKKKIERDAVHVILVGKPKESSRPGEHPGVLSIRDAKNGSEYVSVPFKVEIVDYAFDHISRPMLARGAAVLAGIGGVLSFALTIFEQVDKGFGLASGTAGGFIALLLFRWTVGVYQKPSVSAGGDI